MGLLGSLFGRANRHEANYWKSERRRLATKNRRQATAEKRRKAAEVRDRKRWARAEAKRIVTQAKAEIREEKRQRAEENARARADARAARQRERDEERQRQAEDKRARRLGQPTWRNPGAKRRRNPADAADLARARRMSREFHGSDDEVIELDESERRLPKYVVALGEVPEMSYEPSARFSKRAGWKWVHESGDRGDGKPRSRQRPVLAADPATGRPVIVPMRSAVRMNFRRGLVG